MEFKRIDVHFKETNVRILSLSLSCMQESPMARKQQRSATAAAATAATKTALA